MSDLPKTTKIHDLPKVYEINDSDIFIIQSDDSTNKIDGEAFKTVMKQQSVEALSEHTSNEEIHITQEERELLKKHTSDENTHITQEERELLEEHTSNEEIHITQDERELWNNTFSEHTSNEEMHITQDERELWNSMTGGGSEYFAKQEDIDAIINGTQSVGNSNKFDGKESSAYVEKTQLMELINNLIESGDLEVGEKAYTPSNNLIETVSTIERTLPTDTNSSGSQYLILAKWVPKHSGQVKIGLNLTQAATNNSGTAVSSYFHIFSLSMIEGSNYGNGYSVRSYVVPKLDSIAPGGIYSPNSGTPYDSLYNYGSYLSPSSTGESFTHISVEKGVIVYITAQLSSTSGAKVKDIKIYADEV